MKFSLLFLAALPATLASQLAYTPPADLVEKAKHGKHHCVLPSEYHVRDFTATTNNTGHSLTSYKFTFLNKATNSSTACEYGPLSKPVVSANSGGLPRYACTNKDVSFVWQNRHKKLSMIQKVCPDAKGHSEYEASGTTHIPLSCGLNTCQTNSTDHRGIFTSINPIKHGRVIRHNRRGVAWSFDLAN
ncbi:hypothetical protein VFPPC_09225 [Pochonia chlamydosporia 170]|uniref:AA1-like domain-containing protein n=1 Tax=Pochonia chlamydosporia 170 TaxID=1380566 RepID=A0A179FDQ5_METCM|nr:hypothetical protein VFPPC_09225 [Pochonia chlamydosporia 170]OAQ63371.1 hypothetical protein VFPPC_09225 [Pochonia chlamydosporia 170]